MAGLTWTETATEAKGPSRTLRVLIVDRDPLSREVVKKAVQSAGHECLVAGDAEEAWEIFLRSAVDVVISDLLTSP